MALPIKGVEFTFIANLDSVLGQGFQVNPTLAAGDFQVSTDSAAFVSMAVPVVTPSGSASVLVTVSEAQADGETVEVYAKDQTDPLEWNEVKYIFDLYDGSSEELSDIIKGDHIETNTSLVINRAGTTTPVLTKVVTGSLLTPSVTIRTTDP